jgi:hypothetical protein
MWKKKRKKGKKKIIQTKQKHQARMGANKNCRSNATYGKLILDA